MADYSRNCKCKGLEVGAFLLFLRNCNKASAAGAEWSRGTQQEMEPGSHVTFWENLVFIVSEKICHRGF